jgi:hypothetical protein
LARPVDCMTAPPAAVLCVGAPGRAGSLRGRKGAALLARVDVAERRGRAPGPAAGRVGPTHRRTRLCARRALERRRRAVPLGVGSGHNLHAGVEWAISGRVLDVVLIALPELPARVAERVHPVDEVPAVLVARVVLDTLFLGLRQERGQVGEPVAVRLCALLLRAHVELHPSCATAGHDADSGDHVGRLVDGGGDPGQVGLLVPEHLVVDRG